MMPPDQRMVLNLEQNIAHIATEPLAPEMPHGIIDYTAMRLGLSDAGEAAVWFSFFSPPLA